MRTLVTSLQGKLSEVYFWFKKFEEIIHIYEETRENVDGRIQSLYTKAVSLTNKFGSEEKKPCVYEQQINWNNIPLKSVKHYWKRTVHLTFLVFVLIDVKPSISHINIGTLEEEICIIGYVPYLNWTWRASNWTCFLNIFELYVHWNFPEVAILAPKNYSSMGSHMAVSEMKFVHFDILHN